MEGKVDRRLARLLKRRPDIALQLRPDGEGFLYRPRQLLMSAADAGRDDVKAVLDHLGSNDFDVWREAAQSQPGARMVQQPPRAGDEGFAQALEDSLGLVVRYLPPNVSVPSLVNHFRSSNFGAVDRWPDCGVNHVFIGEQAYGGDPADDPIPADGLVSSMSISELAGAGVTVGVLDTGIDKDAGTNHAILSGHFVPESDDVDPLDGPDRNNLLDKQAGHGTFVAGIVMQRAPAARFDPEALLDANGVGDDAHVSLALAAMLRAKVPIVNLSLGGYVDGDVVPTGLNKALNVIESERLDAVVVAAAGNNGESQPFYPAADPRVVAVAAVKADGRPAKFSNFGPWVDACAIGVGVASTFVKGDWDPAHMHPPGNPAPSFNSPHAIWSGTSFAAPRVAGAIAERMSTMTPPSARKAVEELLPPGGPEHAPGFGQRID